MKITKFSSFASLCLIFYETSTKTMFEGVEDLFEGVDSGLGAESCNSGMKKLLIFNDKPYMKDLFSKKYQITGLKFFLRNSDESRVFSLLV